MHSKSRSTTKLCWNNDIDIEDLFMLTENDLHDMHFSIGAKNRLIQFQNCFKKASVAKLKNNVFSKNLLQIILSHHMNYTVEQFLKISKSTKNDLLSALRSLWYQDESNDNHMLEFSEYEKSSESNFRNTGFDYKGKEVIPVKKRYTSSSSQDDRSTRKSVRVNTTNKYTKAHDLARGDQELVNFHSTRNNFKINNIESHFSSLANEYQVPIKHNNFISPDDRSRCMTPTYEEMEVVSALRKASNKKTVLMSNKMNLVQQEDPACSSRVVNDRRKYMVQKHEPSHQSKQQKYMNQRKNSKLFFYL